MKVNIGKNTLGDSNKMSLSLREYGRSTYNLSYAWRSTMGVGALTPFMKILGLPGDTFEIDLESKIMTSPTIGPLFGSFKFQADIFTCPFRLYNAMLHNNALKIGLDMSKVKLPQMKVGIENKGDIYFKTLSTSNIFNYLEARDSENLNAVSWLAYWDIFKNYYANKQEDKFPMYSAVKPVDNVTIESSRVVSLVNGTKAAEIVYSSEGNDVTNFEGTKYEITDNLGKKYEIDGRLLYGINENGKWTSNARVPGNFDVSFKVAQLVKFENQGKIKVLDGGNINNALKDIDFATSKGVGESVRKLELFDLSEIDDLRELILSKGKQQFEFGGENTTNIKFVDASFGNTIKEPLGGLAVKTYQSDLFNNWVNNEYVEGENGISKVTAIDTSKGSFTIDTLNLAKKVYEMLNRIALSGGTYKDWIETAYTTDYYFRTETPVYEGGMSSEIEFEAITSLSASNADDYEPLGTLAGRGINTSKKGGKLVIKVNEPCYIMGIASITPRVDYSQGLPFDMELKTMRDLHVPQLDGIGFEDLMGQRLDWRSGRNVAIGKQPAWIQYTTNYNKSFGGFAAGQELEFMVLNRVFDSVWGGKPEASTYIQPELYNNIFATTGNQEQNFWVQIGCGIEARRVMSARQIPNF